MRIAIVILFFVGLLSCNADHNGEDTSTASAEETSEPEVFQLSESAAATRVGKPTKTKMYHVIECVGEVEVPPKSVHSIYPPLAGFIGPVNHYIGEYLSRGRVLTYITHPSIIKIQREYLEDRAELEYLRAEFERKRLLSENDATSLREYQEAQARYQSSEIHLDGLALEMRHYGIDVDELEDSSAIQERIYIRMPVSGYIKSIHVNPGKYMEPTDMMYELIDPQHFHMDVEIFTREVGMVKKGDRIRATIPGIDDAIEGEVFLIARSVHEGANTVHVHGHIDSDQRDLVAGAYIEAQIYADEQEVNALPRAAVVREGSRTFIFVGNGREFRKIPVEIGRQSEEFVEVINVSIAPEEVILLDGTFTSNASEYDSAGNGDGH